MNRTLPKTTRNRAGSALVGTMGLLLVVSLLAGGAITLTAQQRQLAQVRVNSETALFAAEAGINSELRQISSRTGTMMPTQWSTAPVTAAKEPYPGRKGTLPNGATYWVFSSSDAAGTTAWPGTGPLFVTAHARVNGAVRKVQVNGPQMKVSLFSEFAVFGNDAASGDNSLAIGTTGSNNVIKTNGAVGTNGRVQSSGTYTFEYGAAYNCNRERYNGTNFPQFTVEPIYQQHPIWTWPTIPQIVEQYWSAADTSTLASTASYLSSIRENSSKIRTYKTGLAAWAGLTQENTQVAGYPSTGNFSLSLQNKSGNSVASWTVAKLAPGSLTKRTLIFPPGDYFFNSVDLQYDLNTELIIDNAGVTVGGNPEGKQVRFWIMGSGTRDTIDLPIKLTDNSDPKTFRIYYGKDGGEFEFRRHPNATGVLEVAGSIYAIVAPYGDPLTKGTKIDLVGGTDKTKTIHLRGALIGDRVEFNGYCQITHPGPAGINSPYDPAGYYNFGGSYKEGM